MQRDTGSRAGFIPRMDKWWLYVRMLICTIYEYGQHTDVSRGPKSRGESIWGWDIAYFMNYMTSVGMPQVSFQNEEEITVCF